MNLLHSFISDSVIGNLGYLNSDFIYPFNLSQNFPNDKKKLFYHNYEKTLYKLLIFAIHLFIK